MYCVYLTTYFGNKLPPFYIGSTSAKKILNGYNGSVSSQAYKQIWKTERDVNPDLFITRVIKMFNTRNEATAFELKIQKALRVVENNLYINKGYASMCFYEGSVHSPESRLKISAANRGKKKPPRSKSHCEKLSAYAKMRITSESTKKKLSLALKGRTFSEETREKLSTAAKNRVYPDDWAQSCSRAGKGIKKSEAGTKNITLGNKGKNKGKIGIWIISTRKQKKIFESELGMYDKSKYVFKKSDLPPLL